MHVKRNGVEVTKLNCSEKSQKLDITCDEGYTLYRLENEGKVEVNEGNVIEFKCERDDFNYICEGGMSPYSASLLIFVMLVCIQDTFEFH